MTVELDFGDDLVVDPQDIEVTTTPPAVEKQGDLFEDPLDDDEAAAIEAAAAEAAAAADKAAREAGVRIPKARFDQAVAKERAKAEALQAELDALKRGQQAASTDASLSEAEARLAALQDAYEDALLEGDKAAARAARTEAEQLRNSLFEYKAQVAASAARGNAVQDMQFSEAVTEIEELYPVLNPDDDSYDEDVSGEVIGLMNALVATGTNKVEAMAKAVSYVLGQPGDPAADVAAPAKPAYTPQDMAKAARIKALAAANAQPPSTKNTGLDNGGGTVDMRTMTQEKFAKLDDDTLAKLRGDIL
jgi:hypothetical protein